MKKRFLAGFLALCMVLSLTPGVALAAGTSCSEGCENEKHKAAIGNQHYETLQAAFDDVETGKEETTTVTLLRDETATSTVTVASGQNITLDLNGKTLTGTGDTITVNESGTLTMIGSGIVTDSGTAGNGMVYNQGTLTIGEEGSSVNTNIQLNATASYAIYCVKGSTTNIYAGTTVSSGPKYTVQNYGGELNIYGGTFVATGTHVIVSMNNTAAVTNISGGTFTAPEGKQALYVTKGTATVTGGTFNTDPSDYLGPSAAAELNSKTGFYKVGTLADADAEALVGSDYYASVARALDAATEEGTVTLLKDVTRTSTVKITKSVTLDLNGHTIDASSVDAGITVDAGTKNVTIQNGTITAKEQAICASGGTTTSGAVTLALNGLTLSTGTGDNTGSVAWYNNYAGSAKKNKPASSLTITNCTLGDSGNSNAVCAVLLGNGSKGTVTLANENNKINTVNGTICVDSESEATLNITGGKFTSTNLFPSDYTKTKDCVVITGGLFSTYIDNYLGDNYQCVPNTDVDTKTAYPYMVEYVEGGVTRTSFFSMSDAGVTTWRDNFGAAVDSGDKSIYVKTDTALTDELIAKLDGANITTLDSCKLTYDGTLVTLLGNNSTVSLDLSGATLTCTEAEYTGLVIVSGKLTAGQLTEGTYSDIRAGNYLADGYGITGSFAVGKISNYSCKADDDLLVSLNGTSVTKYDKITLLKDVTTDVTVSTATTCTIDLDGHTWYYATYYNGNDYALSVTGKGANITVKNGTIDYVVASRSDYAIVTNGSENCSDVTLTLENLTVNSANWGMYLPSQNGETTITDCNITGGETGIEIRAGKLTVNGNKTVITGNDGDFGTRASESGTTIGGVGIGVSQHTTKKDILVTINGGTIRGYYALYEKNVQNNSAEDIAKVKLSITGGQFEVINGGPAAIYSEDCTGFIKGGTFSTDPGEYCADNYASTYNAAKQVYEVKAKSEIFDTSDTTTTDTALNVKPGVKENTEYDADALASSGIEYGEGVDSKAVESEIISTVSSVQVPDSVVTTVNDDANLVSETLENNRKEVSDIAKALAEVKKEEVKEEDIYFYTQTSMKIEPKAYDSDLTKDSESNEVTGDFSMTLEIEPQVQVVASTAKTAEKAKVGTNAVTVGTAQKVDTTGQTVKFNVQLSDKLAGKDIFISHKADDGNVYIDKVKADSSGAVTVTNDKGFSPFTFSTTDPSVANVDGKAYYATLQQAVDASNGNKITVTKDDPTAVAVNQAVTIVTESGVSINVSPAPGYQMVSDGTNYVFTAASTSSTDATETPSPEPSDPGNTEEPSTPSEPGNTEEPSNPTDPGNTEEPANPTDPGNTEEPLDPNGPFQSADDEAKLVDTEVTVVLNAYTFKYTGKPIKPTVTVYDSTGAKLKKSDYEVVGYTGNTEVGPATVTVKLLKSGYVFKENDDTTIDVDFQIVEKTSGLFLTAKNITVNYGATETEILSKIKAKVTLKQGSTKIKDADIDWNLSDFVDENGILGAGVYPVTVTATTKAGDTATADIVVTIKAEKVTLKSVKLASISKDNAANKTQEQLEDEIEQAIIKQGKLSEGEFTVKVNNASAVTGVSKAGTVKVSYTVTLNGDSNKTFTGNKFVFDKTTTASLKVTK